MKSSQFYVSGTPKLIVFQHFEDGLWRTVGLIIQSQRVGSQVNRITIQGARDIAAMPLDKS